MERGSMPSTGPRCPACGHETREAQTEGLLRGIRAAMRRVRQGQGRQGNWADGPLTLAQAAAELGISRRQLGRLRRQGLLLTFKVGRRRFVGAAELEWHAVRDLATKAKVGAGRFRFPRAATLAERLRVASAVVAG